MNEKKTVSNRIYNYEIDLWKLALTFVIMLFHSHKFLPKPEFFTRGYLAVEMFFMISGYFMAVTIWNKDVPTDRFLKNKLKGLYGYVLTAFAISFAGIMYVYRKKMSVVFLGKMAVLSLWEPLMSIIYGIDTNRGYNGPAWYIGAMLAIMALLYPIIKKYKEYFRIAAPVLALMMYGAIYQANGDLCSTGTWCGFTSVALLRSAAGLLMGVFAYHVCDLLKGIRLTSIGKAAVLIIEAAAGIVLAALFNIFGKFDFKDYVDYIAVIIMLFLVIIIFSGISDINSHIHMPAQLAAFIRKAALLLYLNHRIVVYYLIYYGKSLGEKKQLCIYFAGAAATACLCELICRLAGWLWKKHGRRIKNIFIL